MNLKMGSDAVALRVDAYGQLHGKVSKVECLLVGRDQSRLTAKVAITVAEAVYKGDVPSGVFHIEQVYELADMEDWMEKEISVEVRRDGVRDEDSFDGQIES